MTAHENTFAPAMPLDDEAQHVETEGKATQSQTRRRENENQNRHVALTLARK